MRQNISAKQLNELSEKGKKRLKKWSDARCPSKCNGACLQYLPITGDSQTCGRIIGLEPWLPLPSIGQLIEFLDEKKTIHNWHPLDGCYEHKPSRGWHVVIRDKRFKTGKHETDYLTFEEKELIDGLWKATKEKLNSQT